MLQQIKWLDPRVSCESSWQDRWVEEGWESERVKFMVQFSGWCPCLNIERDINWWTWTWKHQIADPGSGSQGSTGLAACRRRHGTSRHRHPQASCWSNCNPNPHPFAEHDLQHSMSGWSQFSQMDTESHKIKWAPNPVDVQGYRYATIKPLKDQVTHMSCLHWDDISHTRLIHCCWSINTLFSAK